jgi:hypothetical protein
MFDVESNFNLRSLLPVADITKYSPTRYVKFFLYADFLKVKGTA